MFWQFIGVLCTLGALGTLFKMFMLMSETDGLGSGRVKAKARVRLGADIGFIAVYTAIFVVRIVNGHKSAINWILLAINVVSFIGCYLMCMLITKKDDANKEQYRQRKVTATKEKTEFVQARAEYKANKAMADGGAKVVKAKMDTAVATEQAKTIAVKSASAHMALGAIGKPQEALDYAQASGAIAEGKEIADKIADKAMGELAPTVIDGEYKDVTDEAKAVMSDRDAALAEHIKGMSRDALEQVIIKGAEKLELNVGNPDVAKLSKDVYRYSPQELKEAVPEELTDEQKAAFLIERMTSDDEA